MSVRAGRGWPREIGRRCSLDKSTVTGLLGKMERQGLAIELAPNVVVGPGGGGVRGVARVRGREFGCVKVYFDLTLVLVALALSFLFFHGLRAGTVVSALLVGRIVTFTNRHVPLIRCVQKWAEPEANTLKEPK